MWNCREFGYRWQAVSCLGHFADYVCTLRSPKCPEGYKWLSQFDSSCFKITSTGPYQPAEIKYSSVWTSEAMCAEEGTRLAVFRTLEQGLALKNWLNTIEPWSTETNADFSFYLGFVQLFKKKKKRFYSHIIYYRMKAADKDDDNALISRR